jgi:ion channel-forming bestrophin family protein
MLLNKRVPLLYIFNKVKTELFYVLIIALCVYFITKEFIYLIPEIPYAIPTFLGTAISVILSFKLSQSYDRWWEARKIWGSIVNDSRNLVLQLQALVRKGNEQKIRTIAFRQIGWCYSLGQTLRQLNPLNGLENFISEQDLSRIRHHKNTPLAIIQLNNQDIAELRDNNQVDSFGHVQINNTLVNLVNYMGMAERIKSTIFPVTYRLFLHMIIYLFIITLSISLRDLKSYFEIPLLLIIASFFFLLERTATHLQDPFSNKPTDTAMTAIARTIEINIKQLINETELPEPIEPAGFYIK